MKRLTVIFFLFLIANCFGQKQFEVFFDFNIDYPNQQSIEKLNAWIEKNKKVRILKVEGYCDSIDTKDYNKKLSERRIENVLKINKKRAYYFKKFIYSAVL